MSHPAPPSPGTTDVVQLQYVSTTNIQPAVATHIDSTQKMQQLHLTPWELCILPIHYVQKGLLFMKPTNKDEEKNLHIISHLKTTLSQVLTHFYPLAGRLGTTFHDEDNTTTVYINCNSAGAEFIHATAEISVSDVLNPVYVPSIVRSFFPHLISNYDGRTQPLLSVQVTELIDGIFIGLSINHSVSDGTSFWHFFNSWSEIARNYSLEEDPKYVDQISRSPIFKRRFLYESDIPIHIPFTENLSIPSINDAFTENIHIHQLPPQLKRRIFHFSSENIAKLKSKANFESGLPISSYQALLAHVWIGVTRARRLDSNQVTNFFLPIGIRKKLNPPLPEEYFGNVVIAEVAQAKAGELLEKGLGFGASLINKLAETEDDGLIRSSWKTWVEKPTVYNVNDFNDMFHFISLKIGDSPKFDMYGNDFGWGRPIALRGSWANKFEGNVDTYPGIVQGSVDIEVYLPLESMEALGGDAEFMEVVTILPPFKKYGLIKHFIHSSI